MQPVDAALELDRLINLLIDWSAAMSSHGTSTESMTINLQYVHQPLFFLKKQEHFSRFFFDKRRDVSHLMREMHQRKKVIKQI